jgi:hypothetical protein
LVEKYRRALRTLKVAMRAPFPPLVDTGGKWKKVKLIFAFKFI